ncbi:hypothetical protein WJX73_000016 [Symbiochloris irregularis]|uniref:Ion transport domain-containing protein n=1 Tax=Symbiochloris irregularis TaxID=706552 RepID=A0AAW1P2T1_9CHLO
MTSVTESRLIIHSEPSTRFRQTPQMAKEEEQATGTSQPLLDEGNDTAPAEHDDTHAAEEGARLNIQQEIYTHPDRAVRWLISKGALRLGSFKVQDTTVRELLRSDEILTLGAASKDVDWQRLWSAILNADDIEEGARDKLVAEMEVEAFVVDVPLAAHADDAGILNPLIKRFHEGLCAQRIFASPAVRAVIMFKWNAWAKRLLYAEFAAYLIWLICFQAFTLLFQDEDVSQPLSKLFQQHPVREVFTIALLVVSTLGMAPFLYIEVCTVAEYGPLWLNAWNIMDVLTYAAQIAIAALYLGRIHLESNYFSVLVALQVLLLWIKVQYFARVLQPTSNPFMETLRSVIMQTKWFIFLLLLTVYGFAAAFYTLFRYDQGTDDFDTIWHSVLTMVGVMLGGADIKLFYGSHNAGVCIALLLVFIFAMSLVLLNCLIGIMADACSRVSNSDQSLFLFSRAQIIDELETVIPRSIRMRCPGWYPRYVHFLQVNKKSADPNLLDEMDPAADSEDGSSTSGITGTLMSYLTSAGGGGDKAKNDHSPAASTSAN